MVRNFIDFVLPPGHLEIALFDDVNKLGDCALFEQDVIQKIALFFEHVDQHFQFRLSLVLEKWHRSEKINLLILNLKRNFPEDLLVILLVQAHKVTVVDCFYCGGVPLVFFQTLLTKILAS